MLAVCLIDCDSSKTPQIRTILERQGNKVETIRLRDANSTSFERFSACIISGGPHLVTDPQQGSLLYSQFSFIDPLKVPTLGICLGHQAIALRCGAQAYRGAERREAEIIKLCDSHPLFNGIPENFSATADHCEGVTLPEGFRKLASSRFYEVEAMACEKRPLVSVQFHPEVSGELGEHILQNFCNFAKASQPMT
ncbi:type 1 glutamine amidotransferase [Dongshaea marina]|uniref:type 1 glutamine amidotransferase n=1 Tax=Dongshaea marina TaxID=2047966 RepID=UPI000D3EC9D3|nr:gamma-glutamyl-gamma-aminobutyrate hydrolase family protein [Dongshaea marina]